MPRKFTPNSFNISGNVAEIFLTNSDGQSVATALVDAEDLDRVLAIGRWHIGRVPGRDLVYAISNIPGARLLHRVVLDAPAGVLVDHRNGNGLDCRKANIRACTHAENMRNRPNAQSNSRSGVRNVRWSEREQKWRVRVKVDKRTVSCGYFDSIEDAAAAAAEACKQLHGEFAA